MSKERYQAASSSLTILEDDIPEAIIADEPITVEAYKKEYPSEDEPINGENCVIIDGRIVDWL